jgi:YidC/Oxa1 family membrane protein insertase
LDRNLILAVALSMLVFTSWSAWQAATAPPPDEAIVLEEGVPETDPESVAESENAVAKKAAETAGQPSKDTQQSRQPSALQEEYAFDAQRVIEPWTGPFDNELVAGRLTNRGATFDRWELKKYTAKAGGSALVELLTASAPYDVALATPFEELGVGDLSSARYEVERADAEGVVFVLTRGGVRVRKTYRPADNDYGFLLDIEVENQTDRTLEPEFELVWPAVQSGSREDQQLALVALADDEVERELVASLGSAGFLGGLFGGSEDEGPPTFGSVKWTGTDLKYFAGLVVPTEGLGSEVVFETLEKAKAGATVLRFEPTAVAPGLSVKRSYFVFLGPKEPELLESLGFDLDRSIDRGYSWVSPLAALFARALHFLNRFFGNYGVTIIVLTILVRLATWPIMARQMRSAEKMREVMPRVKELQEKYKDDKQKQSEETFKLYRETGVNPLAGCFPLLLQMPVFIGLFYALQSSIELRQAPFALWINDLSAPATAFTLPGLDFPVRLLPLLMGGSMYFQQKMTPQTGMDPAQQKMMLVMMPGMMLFISYGFPSGLVLYWTVSNLLGIGHQFWVRRKMQAKEVTA